MVATPSRTQIITPHMNKYNTYPNTFFQDNLKISNYGNEHPKQDDVG